MKQSDLVDSNKYLILLFGYRGGGKNMHLIDTETNSSIARHSPIRTDDVAELAYDLLFQGRQITGKPIHKVQVGASVFSGDIHYFNDGYIDDRVEAAYEFVKNSVD